MNASNAHPDRESLDRLRADLLDDESRRRELEQHLRECAVCRQRYDWQGLMKAADLAGPALEQQLDHAREQALRAPRRSLLSRRLVPLAVAASIALLAVILVNPLQQAPDPDTQLARDSREAPELYEELDFYLWLADHKHANEDSAT